MIKATIITNHVMALAGFSRLRSMKDLARYGRPCGICDGCNVTGTGFSLSALGFPYQLSFLQISILILNRLLLALCIVTVVEYVCLSRTHARTQRE